MASASLPPSESHGNVSYSWKRNQNSVGMGVWFQFLVIQKELKRLTGIALSTNSQHPAQKACGKDKETCQQKSAVRCGGDAICEFLLLSETYHAHTRVFWVDSVQHVQ